MSVDPEVTPEPGNSTIVEPPQDNWEQRFKDTQAAYTKSQQELAQLQKLANGDDPESLKAVLEKYGYELDDEPEELEPEPVVQAKPDPRVDELEKWKTERDAERANEAFQKDLSKAAGDREFPEYARHWVLDEAIKGGNNYEALEKAVKAVFAEEDKRIEQLAQTKKQRPRVPHVPTGGQPPENGGKDPADMTRSERIQFMTDRLHAEGA